MKVNKKSEFYEVIQPILENEEFQKLKNMNHHGITRYEHSLRVAYYTYWITKKFHLRYQEATIGALLHDFFTDEVEKENGIRRLQMHPIIAYQNASNYFLLNSLQEDIIKKHMFPITFRPPKYLESWIVDLVDDVSAIYEQGHSVRLQLRAASTFLFLLLMNFLSMH